MAKPPRPLTFLSKLHPPPTAHSPFPSSSHHTPHHTPQHTYHSHTYPPPAPFPRPETAILTAALAHVPAHGFTRSALALGARDAGYVGAAANLFPGGAVALVRFHLVAQRRALGDRGGGQMEVNGEGDRGGNGREEARRSSVEAEVSGLVWRRLVGNEAVVHRWPEALALLALPANVPTAVRELALLADEILHQAGDSSVDAEWYTKRAALSALYASCELFMTQDASPGFVDTSAFLARRMEDARRARARVAMVRAWVGWQGYGVLNVLRSKGVRV